MVKVKICGITKEEDISFLENFPVDYLGFIMYPPSPRYVGDHLKRLLREVKRAKRVVVMVNPTMDEVLRCLDLGADLIQLHGEESVEFGDRIGLSRVIKAFRVRETIDCSRLEAWKKAYAVLLDTYKEGLPGGTGETFNWQIAQSVVLEGYKVFLAGGLNLTNVVDALITVKPYAIDLSSGLEISPGIKDYEKVKALFEILRRGVDLHP
ncbi:MAG: phosphoribosylanthranilate isomerase [Caldimicrobium sp.]|nr:phosphoribosylanthranilate isomerase [Caldimicrobium sp.]MDW8182530.1 phosphoribosylanthranilate isomerase [Caldimicrobium sp.]